jgi:hypothetical protein
MPEHLTRQQAWFLRIWVYGILLGFLGYASSYGPFTSVTISYKVVRFLLVFWFLLAFDRRGNMDRALVRNLAKYIILSFLGIAVFLGIIQAGSPKPNHPFINLCLLSATLALPIGTSLALFFTNAASRRLEAVQPSYIEQS